MGTKRNREKLTRYLVKKLIIYTLVLGTVISLIDSLFEQLTAALPADSPMGLYIAALLLLEVGVYAAFVVCFSKTMHRHIQQHHEGMIKERVQLMADIGHDLRTPLTSIKGFSRAISSGRLPGDEETMAAAQTIHRKSLEMEELLTELLNDARIGNQESTKPLSPVSINTLLRGIIAEHYAGFEEKEMDLSCELAEDVILTLNEQGLKRAFENILLNALRHCQPGTRVLVKTQTARRRFKRHLHILVADSGSPIPPAQQAMIFKPFVKLDDSRGQNAGYGLGLAIAHETMKQARGNLFVETLAPPYTKAFVMVLPLM